MKTFTVTEQGVEEGFAVLRSPFAHVALGNIDGRLYRVTVGSRDFPVPTSGPDRVFRVSAIRTRMRDTLVLVSERDPEDPRCLVVVDIINGFRGRSADDSWTGIHSTTEDCPLRGQPIRVYRCELCKLPLPASLDTTISPNSERNVHPNYGTYKSWDPFPDPPEIVVLAKGEFRMNDSNHQSSHQVRLLLMEPHAAFRIHLRGRFNVPRAGEICRYIRWSGTTLLMGEKLTDIYPEDEEVEGETTSNETGPGI